MMIRIISARKVVSYRVNYEILIQYIPQEMAISHPEAVQVA